MSRDTGVNVRPRSLSVTGTARAWWPPAARVTGSRPSRQPRRCCRRPAPCRWADSWPQGRATCSPMTSERRWSRLTDTRAAGWRTRPAGRSQCCSVGACSACCPCRCYAGCAGSNGNSPTVCRGRTDRQTQRHKMVRRKDPFGKVWSGEKKKNKRCWCQWQWGWQWERGQWDSNPAATSSSKVNGKQFILDFWFRLYESP